MMLHTTRTLVLTAFVILACPVSQAFAQTKYTVRILNVPPPLLGGNVSSINNGTAVGWGYTNCQGQLGCVSQVIPVAWPDLVTPVDLREGSNNIQLPSQMQGVFAGMYGGWETDGLAHHAILIDPSGKTDLNGIFFASQILAMCNGYQAGMAQTTPLTNSGGGSQRIIFHAMLWSGSVNSWVDLHNQQDVSEVTACDGNTQVGWAGSGFQTHAVMWTGTRTSEIDLHSGASQSDQATAVSGNTQAGWGAFEDKATKQQFAHALIWHGASNTLTDIHPAGYQSSQIFAAAGSKQVGFATNATADAIAPGTYHGLLWFGTAASVVDLNQFLPPGYTDSQTVAIDPVTGIIAGAAKGPKGVFEPALWVPAQ
ncbi:MAG TPA: hypothetical protein VKU01_25030 [Bryobacteraceae bacterium]|nr:hypothetical protein [Bryobacteraceae bacterium]